MRVIYSHSQRSYVSSGSSKRSCSGFLAKCLPRLLASPLYGFSSHGSCRPAGKSHPDRRLQSCPVVGDNDMVH